METNYAKYYQTENEEKKIEKSCYEDLVKEDAMRYAFRLACKKTGTGFKPDHYRSNALVWDEKVKDYVQAQLVGLTKTKAVFEAFNGNQIRCSLFNAADVIKLYYEDLIDDAVATEGEPVFAKRVLEMREIQAQHRKNN